MEEEKKLLEGEEKLTDEDVTEDSETVEIKPEEETIDLVEEPEMKTDESVTPADTSAEGFNDPITDATGEIHDEPVVEENGAFETSIRTFTQDDVDKLVGDTRIKTREKTFRYIYDRYGVKNEDEMDALVANAQRYDTQKEMYENDKNAWETERSENSSKLSEMSEQIALMQSEIDPARYEDAKLILKGKGMDVTLENIQSQLETHPEWKKSEETPEEVEEASEVAPVVKTRITTLGNEPKPAPQETDEEKAEKLFKMKFH